MDLPDLATLQDTVSYRPYSILARLSLGKGYVGLKYPDLAAGEAYLALLLVDELGDESGERHEDVVEAVKLECEDQDQTEMVNNWERET
jgi:hypothetical protein